jgi:hypothetical protein
MNFNRFFQIIFVSIVLIMVSCSKDEDDENSLPIIKRGNWFTEKIWCHRVNTIEKVNRLDKLWKGLEMDIYYENDKLIVKHDAEDTTTLTLQQLMESMEDSHSHYFWFDLKNIGSENYVALSTALISVVKSYSNIDNCIFESWMPDYMSVFVEEDCHTSFFINFYGLVTDEEYLERVESITQYVTLNKISAISTGIYEYDLMKKYFPDYNKLTWYAGSDIAVIDSLRNVISDDNTLQVCLFEEDFY